MNATSKSKTPKTEAAAAVSAFAARWEQQLGRMAVRVTCQCRPQREGDDESDHDPGCPLGVLRQAGRLMREEADEYSEAVR